MRSFFLVLSGLEKGLFLDLITSGQSPAIFLCIGPFLIWWRASLLLTSEKAVFCEKSLKMTRNVGQLLGYSHFWTWGGQNCPETFFLNSRRGWLAQMGLKLSPQSISSRDIAIWKRCFQRLLEQICPPPSGQIGLTKIIGVSTYNHGHNFLNIAPTTNCNCWVKNWFVLEAIF